VFTLSLSGIEFHAEKDYRIRGGPPRATGYENAIRALQSCTTKYEHPSELKALSGVGPTCISRLIEKLEQYCKNRRIPMPEPSVKKGRGSAKAKATTAEATTSKLTVENVDTKEGVGVADLPKKKAERKTRGKYAECPPNSSICAASTSSTTSKTGSKRKRTDVDDDFDELEAGDVPADRPAPIKVRRTSRAEQAISYDEE